MFVNLLIHSVPAITVSFITQLLLHEVGHLLGGLFTRWHFIYLQLFNVVVIKRKRIFALKIVNSSNFQCIMNPESINSNPYIYTLGGCLMNLLLAILGLIVMIAESNSIIISLYSWSFFVMGLGFFIMNGVPRVKRICNDMACYQLLKKDSLTRQCHNAQLTAAKLLFEGFTYKQIGEEILSLPSDEAYNDILAYQAILEYYYYLDIEDNKSQKRALDKIKNESKSSNSTICYLHMELLYENLISQIKNNQQSSKDIDYVNIDKATGYESVIKIDEVEMFFLKCYIKGDVHMERVKAAYDVYKELINGNRERVKERIIEAIDYIRNMNCIYSGEKEFCIRQLRLLQAVLENS
jgi:uncharacterized protein YlzI (FlbEa/FlbD family)